MSGQNQLFFIAMFVWVWLHGFILMFVVDKEFPEWLEALFAILYVTSYMFFGLITVLRILTL